MAGSISVHGLREVGRVEIDMHAGSIPVNKTPALAGHGVRKMDVILLKKVDNLGGLGDRVKVKPGYGRNFLIPSGRATAATEENIKAFEARRAELEKAAADALAAAQARAEKLEGMTITIASKAGDEGKLFGSVGNSDVADAITAAGVVVERSEVRMPDGAFRMVGEYEVQVHLHSDVNATVNIVVAAE